MSKYLAKSLLLTGALTGCAFDGSLTERQLLQQRKEIETQYARAGQLYKQKMAPLAQYFASVCGPKPDKEYVECINGKRTEIRTLSVYPENASTRERRLALEQRLIDRQIDRKQFRAGLEELRNRYYEERLQQDVAAGIYSGQY